MQITFLNRGIEHLMLSVFLLASFSVTTLSKTPALRTVSINYEQVSGKNTRFYSEVVGAGRAAEGLRADWQRDLAVVQRECGFKYVRFHGLLHDEMGVYSEDRSGRPVYNFQYIDALYDSILNIGMKPFVELSFMPDKLRSSDKTIFWWKGNISPPKDDKKWSDLIRALTEHWTKRYGEEEVKQWYFEVWNEPNLDFFFTGSQADYFRLYTSTVNAIKSVSPKYRVGGPATAGRAWVPETIDFAVRNKVPLDFITTHDYGVSGIGFDDDGVQKLFLDTSRNAIIGGVRDVKKQIRSSAMPQLPLHYTEWSSSYSPRDPVHDSYISAPYILSKLKGSAGYAESMSYWTFTDIFEENGPVPDPFHGGFGMINFQGLRKPSFYAYQFLHRLGDEELKSTDAESWITRTKNGVQVLLWNFTPPTTAESDQVFYKKDLPAKDLGKVLVSVSDVPAGNYKLSLYRVGYKVNDVYSSYLAMGSPHNLSRAQVRELDESSSGKAVETLSVKIAAKKPFVKQLSLRENDVYLMLLERSKRPAEVPA